LEEDNTENRFTSKLKKLCPSLYYSLTSWERLILDQSRNRGISAPIEPSVVSTEPGPSIALAPGAESVVFDHSTSRPVSDQSRMGKDLDPHPGVEIPSMGQPIKEIHVFTLAETNHFLSQPSSYATRSLQGL